MNLKTRSTIAGVALTLGFFLFSAFDLYSDQNNCGGPCAGVTGYCGCINWSNWGMRSDNITLPNFPNCTLRVNYCYRQCMDDPKCVEIDVSSFSYVNPEDCTDMREYYNSGTAMEIAVKKRDLYFHTFRQIATSTFDQYCADQEENNRELPWCDTPDRRYKVSTYPSKCMATCTTQYPVDDPGNPYLITYIRCETEAICCTKTLAYCKLRPGGETIIEEMPSQVLQCEYLDPPPVQKCPPGMNVDITPCINYCEE